MINKLPLFIKKNGSFSSYLSILCFSIILLYTPTTTIGHNQLLFVIAGLSCLLSYEICINFRKQLQIPSYREPSLVFSTAYFIFAIVSLSWSSFHPFSNIILITQFSAVLGFGLGYFWSDKKAQAQTIIFTLIALGFGLSTLYHFFFKNELGNFFGNPNTYVAFMAMLLVPIYCQFLNRALEKKSLYLIGSLVFLITLPTALIYSRGGLLTLTITLSLLSLTFLWHKQSTTIISLLKLFAILIIVPPLVYILYSHSTEASNFASGKILTEGFKMTGQVGRGGIWAAGWRMFLDNPFWGWGLGTFRILFPQYRDGLNLEAGYFAHNDYLQVLIELGIFGFLLLMGFVLSLLVVTFKAAKKADTAEKRQALSYAIACIGMLAHTFFDFNLYRLPTLLLMGFYLGLFFRAQPQTQQSFIPASKISAAKYYGTVSLITTIIVIWLGSFGLFFHFINQSGTAQTFEQKLALVKTADLFYSRSGDYESQQAIYWMINLFSVNKQKISTEKINTAGKEILTLLDNSIRKKPLDADNYLKKAQLLQFMYSTTHQQEILENYALALKMNPNSFEVRSRYAEYLNFIKKHQQALKILWGAWGRVYPYTHYQDMSNYLIVVANYNHLYGKDSDNAKILAMQNHVSKLLKTKKRHSHVIFQ